MFEFGSRSSDFVVFTCVTFGMWEQHGRRNKLFCILLLRVFKQTLCFHCRVTRKSKGNDAEKVTAEKFLAINTVFTAVCHVSTCTLFFFRLSESFPTCSFTRVRTVRMCSFSCCQVTVGCVGSSVCGHQCVLWTVECIFKDSSKQRVP